MFLRTILLTTLTVLGLQNALAAEIGVTDKTIVLGQSVALSGPLGDLGTEYQTGGQIYFDHVNSQGGVFGRQIKLISLDDSYEVPRAVENTKKLVEQEKIFAIFGQFGTGLTLATLPLTTAVGVPLFAPYTGADVLRDNNNRYLFHIRSTYGEETDKIIEQLVATGVRNIAIVYQNDSFGKAGLQGAERALARRNLQPAAVGAIEMPAVDVKKAVETIAAADPGAIVMSTAGKPSVHFIKEYKKTGRHGMFYAMSVVSSRQLVKELGHDSHGIAISQVIPSPWRSSNIVAREYQQLLAKRKSKDYGYTAFESFIAAKVFVEGLRRAGKDLTRDKLVTALEGMRHYDVGGMVIDFGPAKHNGSSYVDMSIISRDGAFLR